MGIACGIVAIRDVHIVAAQCIAAMPQPLLPSLLPQPSHLSAIVVLQTAPIFMAIAVAETTDVLVAWAKARPSTKATIWRTRRYMLPSMGLNAPSTRPITSRLRDLLTPDWQ